MTREAKWPAAPWHVEIRGERGTFHIPEEKAAELVASDIDGCDGCTVSHATRNLIAAAPAMAEIIGTIILNAEIIPDPRMEGSTDCVAIPLDDFDALKAALTRAHGETQ